MSVTERSLPGYVQQCCHISLKDILKIYSSTFVPLMIGVMTLVITIQQHNQGNRIHLNDLQIAKELREQQLKLEELRRT